MVDMRLADSVGRVLLSRPGVRTLVLAGLCLAFMVSGCTSGPGAPEQGDYTAQLTAFRDSKNRQFREEKDPIPANRKDKLLPLLYFPADESYIVPAQLRL